MGTCCPSNVIKEEDVNHGVGLNENEEKDILSKEQKIKDLKKFEYENSYNCGSVKECKCIDRIIEALKFCDEMDEKYGMDSMDKILEYFNDDNYSNLDNDFNHILSVHLNENIILNNTLYFKLIYDKIIRSMSNGCNLNNECLKFKRINNNNNHRQNDINNNNNQNIDDNILINNKDALYQYYTECMDIIHCHFMHSYDIGFRLNMDELNELNILNEQKNNNNDDEFDDIDIFQDKEMMLLNKLLCEKKKNFTNFAALKRLENNKFFTVHNDDICVEPEYGKEFNYWRYPQLSYDEWNEEWKGELYVLAKYSGLKNEIISNNLCPLSIDEYNRVYFKAERKIKSVYSKQIKAGSTNCYHSNIYKGDPLRIIHIMSIIFYTDYNLLRFKLSQTFYKLNKDETLKAIKLRNSEFANLSQFIRETVERYCPNTSFDDNSMHPILYHGINYFDRHFYANLNFRVFFRAPTSATTQISVINVFCSYNNDDSYYNNGFILDLKQDENYFSVYWLSKYSNEDERLFCGRMSDSNLSNIRSIKANQSYKLFIDSLCFLMNALNIPNIHKFGDITVNKMHYDIIHRLLSNLSLKYDEKNKNKFNVFPVYIQNMFNNFVEQQNEIKIDIYSMFKNYQSFCKYFIDLKCDQQNLILLDKICFYFKKCEKITVGHDDYDEYCHKYENITSYYMSSLLSMLENNKCCILKEIYLRNIVKYEHQSFDSSIFSKEYESKFNKLNFDISYEQRVNSYQRQEPTNIFHIFLKKK